nr:NADH dehydrogenase subunit 6 [Himaloaesalus gaoligongshanus]WQF69244.1 NADH dehydrogenase subunit 6 [Himaloaesalus gaoligongshanus]
MLITLSIMLPMLNHPIPAGGILLILTFLIASITGFMNMNFWYSYIIFIVMIGGLMVLFMYMTSVASNEKLKYSNKVTLLTIFIMTISTLLMVLIDKSSMFTKISYTDNMSSWKMYQMTMNKFINYPMMMIYMLMIIYLLIILITSVKIININKGPLRTKN